MSSDSPNIGEQLFVTRGISGISQPWKLHISRLMSATGICALHTGQLESLPMFKVPGRYSFHVRIHIFIDQCRMAHSTVPVVECAQTGKNPLAI